MKLIYENSPQIPDIVYHGGYKMIEPNEFSTQIHPCFFTPYKEYADSYANDPRHKNNITNGYHLDIKNPFHLEDPECLRIYKEEFIPWCVEKGYADDWKNQNKLMNPTFGSLVSFVVADYLYVFLRKMRRKGIYNYDGMIVSEGVDEYEDSYVPLDNSQISWA